MKQLKNWLIRKVKEFINDEDIVEETKEVLTAYDEVPIFDFEKLCLNRWRAVWLNNGGTLDHRKEILEKKAEAAVIAAAKKTKKRASKNIDTSVQQEGNKVAKNRHINTTIIISNK